MGDVVQGAALGAAFDLLFVSVVDATGRVARFSSDLNRLKSTLRSIKLVIDDIENFNRILEMPHHETEIFTDRLLEGEKLIQRCSKVNWWNVFKRLYYSAKLSKLEALLLNFFQIDVAALHFRESKRISVEVSNLGERVSNLGEKMNEMTTMLERIEIGVCSSNGVSEIVVGEKEMHLEDVETTVASIMP